MLLTHCQDRILTENIWFVWSRTSYSGDKWRCYRCGTDDERRTREDRATQPLDAGRLSFAKNTVCIILELLFLDTCKLFVKETPLNSLRLTYTLHYLALHPFGLQLFGSGRVLKWSGRVPNWSRRVTNWSSRVANYSSRVSNWSLAVPNCSSRVTNWSSRVPKWSAESPNGLVGSQNGPVEFLNGPAGSLNNLVGSPNVLDLVGSTNGLDGSLIYLVG